MKLHEYPDHVVTCDDFLAFVHELRKEVVDNPERWENVTLESYLEALAAWVQDTKPHLNGDQHLGHTCWRWFCRMLLAAGIYE